MPVESSENPIFGFFCTVRQKLKKESSLQFPEQDCEPLISAGYLVGAILLLSNEYPTNPQLQTIAAEILCDMKEIKMLYKYKDCSEYRFDLRTLERHVLSALNSLVEDDILDKRTIETDTSSDVVYFLFGENPLKQ